MRKDWQLLEDEIVQANFSVSYPGMVRAWHRHLRGQVDCFVVLKFLKGALKICAYDDETEELDEIVSTGENLQVLVYFVNRLYDYEKLKMCIISCISRLR